MTKNPMRTALGFLCDVFYVVSFVFVLDGCVSMGINGLKATLWHSHTRILMHLPPLDK